MAFSDKIFINFMAIYHSLHRDFPHVDPDEGIALFQRIKNCIVHPDKEVNIADLKTISHADAEAIVNEVMLVFEKQQHWKFYWELNLKGREFNTAVIRHNIKIMSRKELLDEMAKEKGINYDKDVSLPSYLSTKKQEDQNIF